MSRDLRVTLALIAVTLIVASPLIFAAPSPANTNYLALVMHLVPLTNTPLPSATPTNTPAPTLTPAPTNTPFPTATPPDPDIPPIAAPCDQNQPSQPEIGAQAWMSIPSPSRFSQTTICARYIVSGGAVTRGSILEATAHYRTTDTDLGFAVAGNDGVAHISFNIGGATIGYPVVVDGTIGGQPFSTSFTPQ